MRKEPSLPHYVRPNSLRLMHGVCVMPKPAEAILRYAWHGKRQLYRKPRYRPLQILCNDDFYINNHYEYRSYRKLDGYNDTRVTATATVYSHTVVETAGRKTVKGSYHKIIGSGVFLSGGIYPSGNKSNPSGVFPTGIMPSGSGYYTPPGTTIMPFGTGVSPLAREIYPSGTAIKPSGSGIFPSRPRIPSGTGQLIYPSGTPLPHRPAQLWAQSIRRERGQSIHQVLEAQRLSIHQAAAHQFNIRAQPACHQALQLKARQVLPRLGPFKLPILSARTPELPRHQGSHMVHIVAISFMVLIAPTMLRYPLRRMQPRAVMRLQPKAKQRTEP